MPKTLNITISNKVATYCQRDGDIVCGNSDYSIKFTFDAEWNTYLVKTVRFLYNGTAVDVIFEGDTVAVPKLQNTTLLTVGVFAGDLQTTTPATIPCVKSILCQDGLPPDPEPDVYNQIMGLILSGGCGNGIVSIEKTSSEGLIDTYTVKFTNDTTTTFTVTNGAPGPKGDDYTLTNTDKADIAKMVKDSLSEETWTFTLDDGSTVTKVVYV